MVTLLLNISPKRRVFNSSKCGHPPILKGPNAKVSFEYTRINMFIN